MPLNRGRECPFPILCQLRGRKEGVGKGKNGAGILGGVCLLPWIRAVGRAETVALNGKTSTAELAPSGISPVHLLAQWVRGIHTE